jgi:hypothetical protein
MLFHCFLPLFVAHPHTCRAAPAYLTLLSAGTASGTNIQVAIRARECDLDDVDFDDI